MEQVVTTGDTGASSATTAPPAVATESSTTAAPAIQATTTPITDTTGEPPKERWADILANTRTKEREAALTEWRQQYGWAESVNRDQLSQMSEWYQRYQGDPGDFLEKAYAEALSHPIHGATVKSRIGKMLASMRAAQPEPELAPDIPVYNEQGQEVNRTYSAEAMKQIVARAVREAIGKEVDPLKQDFQTRQQQAQQHEQQAFITKESTRIKTAVLKYPQAEAHWPAIQAAAKQIVTADKDISVGEAVRDAYMQVVYPTLGQSAQATVLSDLQRKAHAQTVQPGQPTGTAQPKFKSFSEASAYYAQHPDEAAAMASR